LNSKYKHVINLTRRFKHSLKILSKENQERVLSKVNELGLGIDEGKILRGEYKGIRSLRVGKYRVIYEKPKHCTIILLDIGNRETIYDNL